MRRMSLDPRKLFRFAATQRMFPFRVRMQRLDRAFRLAIVLVTVIGVVGLVAWSPKARSGATTMARKSKWAVLEAMGLEADRPEIDADWRQKRELGMQQARASFRRMFAKSEPGLQALMRVAGMSPDEALIRWGNFYQTLMLSSKVFLPDDHGRSFRLRPNTRSVWVRQAALPENGRPFLGLFLVPDTPEVREAVDPARTILDLESRQTTNSWGCRGPEPDLSAPVRVLVLGDSFMQGMFVGDDDTPPACLGRYLQEAWGAPVSVLNTGHLGYSPEQYYYTLVEYADRFRPQFVVVCLFSNDFGDEVATLKGDGDWKEGEYWLGEIRRFCSGRNLRYLVSVAPLESQVTSQRNSDNYPGRLSRISQVGSFLFVDPTEEFVSEHLRLVKELKRLGMHPSRSLLFNGHIGDGHFSPKGAALWARAVGQRMTLVWSPPFPEIQAPKAQPSRAARPVVGSRDEHGVLAPSSPGSPPISERPGAYLQGEPQSRTNSP
jgi:hypothetical protein